MSAIAATTTSHSSSLYKTKNPLNSFIGKYCLLKTIGKGNFAKVKLARHMLTNQRVAIKIIDKTKLDKTGIRKLYREVRTLKLLSHPNIVRLFEVIDSEKTLYLVMEYLSGGELFDYLVTRGRLKEKEARQMFRQIVSAVLFCHKNKIVHRDLKAENLLLDDKMNVKIADFGFSNTYSEKSKLDTFCGSPPYAAPELFRGERYVGPEVDVWSLGVVLYTLVSGCLPFDGESIKEVRQKVLVGKFRVPFFMSHECHLLLKKLLVPCPLKRSSLEAILGDRWLNIGFDLVPPVFPSPSVGRLDHAKIDLMVTMGYRREQVVESVENRKFDELMATYSIINSKIVSMMTKPLRKQVRPFSTGENAPALGNGKLRLPLQPRVFSGATIASTKTRENRQDCRHQTVTFRANRESFGENPQIRGNVSYHKIDPQLDAASITSFTPPRKYPPTFPFLKPMSNRAAELRLETVKNATLGRTSTTGPEVDTASISQVSRKSCADSNVEPVCASENGLGVSQFNQRKRNPGTDDKPRVLRFTWSMKTTTAMSPPEILIEIFRVLEELSVDYEQREKFVVFCMYGKSSCVDSVIQWDMEICQLPRINLNGIKFKRITGNSLVFKDIAAKVSGLLRL